MSKAFQNLPAVAANIFYNTVENRFFRCREGRIIKYFPLTFNCVKTVILISEIDISVNWSVHPGFALLCKQKCVVKCIKEPLNII